MSSPPEILLHRPSTPNGLPDEGPEFFREATMPDEDEDQPAEYFRPTNPGHIDNEISSRMTAPAVTEHDEPEAWFRPADPGSLDNEILFRRMALENGLGLMYSMNEGYMNTHSTAENLPIQHLLQPFATKTETQQSSQNQGMNTDQKMSVFEGMKEEGSVREDIDTRLIAAFGAVNVPGQYNDSGFINVKPLASLGRHDCPNCNCGH